jgi:hypothetical protein
MRALGWLGISLAIGIAVSAYTSCKSKVSSSTTGTGGAPSGTGGAGGDTTSSSSGTTTSTGPLVCASSYTNIMQGSCDMLQQNCLPGRTCQPIGANGGVTTGCKLVSGLKTAGEPCYDPSECDARFLCVGEPVGRCVAVCCPSNGEPCNGGMCNTQVSFGGGLYVYVCSYGKPCTPLTADACPQGQDCHVEDTSQGLAVCTDPSPQPVGELQPCTYINDCRDMQQCFRSPPSANQGVCLYYCDTTGSTSPPGLGGCNPGEKCVASYNGQQISFGIPNLGLCIPTAGLPDGGTGMDGGGSSSSSSSGGGGGGGGGGAPPDGGGGADGSSPPADAGTD